MAKRATKGQGARPRCELEGDNCRVCGQIATKEVKFPVDYPRDGWIRACNECIDRRKADFTMVEREITPRDLAEDLLAFVKDYYREYEPVSDVNELTETMVNRARALIGRAKKS